MGSAERRQRESAATRQKILDAARDLFVRRGYEATSMRAIAERIEYTPTAIYHHFPGKDALLSELCHRDFRALGAAFQRIGRIDDPVERIQRIGRAYVDFAAEHPMHYQLMFMTARPGLADADEQLRRGDPTEDAYAFLREAVAEAMEQGRFRPEFQSPDRVAQMLWGGLHGLISLRIAKAEDDWIDFDDVHVAALEMQAVLLRGLLQEG